MLRREVQSRNENLMIVGHLPFLNRLAAALLCQDESMPVVAFQQAGIVRLDRDKGGRWSLTWGDSTGHHAGGLIAAALLAQIRNKPSFSIEGFRFGVSC